MDGLSDRSELPGWCRLVKDGQTIPDYGYQVASIIEELGDSITDPKMADRVDHLVSYARMVFHRERPSDRWVELLDFTEDPVEFLQRLQDVPEDVQSELKRAYGSLWVHESPEVWITQGPSASRIIQHWLAFPVDEIENLARMYLHLPGAVSPTLEWVIINSLLYAESLAFLEVQTGGGVSLNSGSVRGTSSWKALARSIGKLSLEALKLGTTAIFSYWVGQGDQAAIVLTFVAITGWRWGASVLRARQSEGRKGLVEAMALTHRLAKEVSSFNARLVRRQAYHATTLGAVFSDYVFEVLDRRVARSEGGIFIGNKADNT